MIKWKRSNLSKGARVKIQEDLLVTHNGKRFIKASYEGETKYGLILRFFFEPGPCTDDTKWWYDTFISWPSLYCGDVKLQTETGKTIRAERLFR